MSSRKRCEEFAQANNITFKMEGLHWYFEWTCSVPAGLIVAGEGVTGYSGEMDKWDDRRCSNQRKAWQELLRDMKVLAKADLITISEYIASGGQA